VLGIARARRRAARVRALVAFPQNENDFSRTFSYLGVRRRLSHRRPLSETGGVKVARDHSRGWGAITSHVEV
jgi:hypothetical protein